MRLIILMIFTLFLVATKMSTAKHRGKRKGRHRQGGPHTLYAESASADALGGRTFTMMVGKHNVTLEFKEDRRGGGNPILLISNPDLERSCEISNVTYNTVPSQSGALRLRNIATNMCVKKSMKFLVGHAFTFHMDSLTIGGSGKRGGKGKKGMGALSIKGVISWARKEFQNT